jgi:hypothetical protein
VSTEMCYLLLDRRMIHPRMNHSPTRFMVTLVDALSFEPSIMSGAPGGELQFRDPVRILAQCWTPPRAINPKLIFTPCKRNWYGERLGRLPTFPNVGAGC